MLRSLTVFSAFVLSVAAFSQTVFIPDVQFRAKLNAWAPGLVDGSGNMPVANAGLHPMEFDLQVDWSPADLTGIEALESMYMLTLSFDPGVALTLTALGSAEQLALIDYPLAALPTFGSTMELTIRRAPLMTSFPLISVQDLGGLHLEELNALQSAPIIPDGVQQLMLRGYPASIPMPVLPQSVFLFVSDVSDNATLPFPFPDYMETIHVDSMFNLVDLPNGLPGAFLSISITNTGLSELDIAAGGNMLQLNVTDNAVLQSVQCSSRVHSTYIATCPALTEVAMSDGEVLEVANCSTFQDLSFGLEYVTIIVTDGQLASISDFPPTLQYLFLANVQFDVPPLPDGLLELGLVGSTMPSLPVLPASLTTLDVGYSLNLAGLPDLPEGLQVLNISATTFECLPVLPDGLQTLDVVNASVTCMPNHPSAVGALLPLCTILNTSCPEYAPYVSGHVFRDDDGNGQQDPGEPNLMNAVVTESPFGYMTGTDSLGNYTMALPIGSHEITAESNLPYNLSTLPTSYTVDLLSPDTVASGLDFAVQMDTVVVDTRVVISSWSQPRPGYQSGFGTVVLNDGPGTVYDLEVQLEYDPLLVPIGATENATITPTMVIWEIDSVEAGGWYYCGSLYQVPIGATLGDTIFMTARVLPVVLQDANPANNDWMMADIVVGSYDPNDKRVSPEVLTIPQGASGERVEYIIRFQNTGTFYAERVLITDTLSADLDPTTFEFLGASHACEWFYREGALHFLFAPIFLPDSTSDEPGSHGSVLFAINTVPGLTPGSEVPNEANIYFDFNAPVITDTCVLEVELPQALMDTGAQGIELHPVPSTGLLYLNHAGQWNNASFTVLDATGAFALKGRIMGASMTLDLRTLAEGLYLLRVDGATGTWTGRVIKE